MGEQDGDGTMGLGGLNPLLAWRGYPDGSPNGVIGGQVKHFQAFVFDLQKSYTDAFGLEMRTLSTANEQLVRCFQELLRCRQPQDALVAELNILATLLDLSSRRTKTWVELMEKVQDCCSAMTGDAMEELRKKASEKIEPKAPPK